MSSLCNFCLIEVWGEKGWAELWKGHSVRHAPRVPEEPPEFREKNPSHNWSEYYETGDLRFLYEFLPNPRSFYRKSYRPVDEADSDHERSLEYERPYHDIKRAAEESCVLCQLICNKLPDFSAKPKSVAIVRIAICHPVPRKIIPRVCAEIRFDYELCNTEHDIKGSFFMGVSTAHDQPAMSHYLAPIAIYGAYSNFDPSVAKQFIRTCEKTHKRCRKTQPTRLPKRVVDCGTADATRVYLREPGDEKFGRFTALSYVWGGAQPLLTTKDNLAVHRNGIELCSIPKTIRDAILVTRELNLRYLWVDALCIVQDSAQDKIEQLARMKEYYREAFCVIAASASSRVADGFINYRIQSSDPTAQEEILEVTETRIGVPFVGPAAESGVLTLSSKRPYVYHAMRDPLATRAWVLQERLLSRRCLLFPSTGGFALQCDSGEQFAGDITYACDNAEGRERMLIRYEPSSEWSWSRDLAYDHPEEYSFTPIQETRDICQAWRVMVESYSSMKLSVSEDRSIAIAALAEEHQERYLSVLRGDYLAGHWHDDLHESLMWKVVGAKNVRPAYRAPSWSWLSVDGAVSFRGHHAVEDEYLRIIEISATPREPSLTYGSLRDGFIKVEGSLIQAFWHIEPEEVLSDGRSRRSTTALIFHGNSTSEVDTWRADAWPDTLESVPQGTRPVHALLLNVAPNGSVDFMLLRPEATTYDGITNKYRRVGLAHFDGDGINLDSKILFGGESVTIYIV